MKRFLVIALAVMMSGCASMNADQCAMSDWHAVGYEDGSRGYTSDRFGQYRKACAKHSIAPDFQAYQVGRKEGLVEFCQPSRGFNLGAAGGRYNGVCDVAMEEEFLDAFRVGSQLYTLRSNVNRVNGEIASREQEMEKNADIVKAKEAALIAADTTVEDRVLILADLKRLSEEQGALESEIEQLIDERARHETELADYQTTVAAYGY
jgi:hypothetical protein